MRVQVRCSAELGGTKTEDDGAGYDAKGWRRRGAPDLVPADCHAASSTPALVRTTERAHRRYAERATSPCDRPKAWRATLCATTRSAAAPHALPLPTRATDMLLRQRGSR